MLPAEMYNAGIWSQLRDCLSLLEEHSFTLMELPVQVTGCELGYRWTD